MNFRVTWLGSVITGGTVAVFSRFAENATVTVREKICGGVLSCVEPQQLPAEFVHGPEAAESFQGCLFEAAARFGWRLHAFVIMSNHYHLAVETPEPNPSEGMKWLQGTWAMHFNRFRGEGQYVRRFRLARGPDSRSFKRALSTVTT